jgi:hypothetical protein
VPPDLLQSQDFAVKLHRTFKVVEAVAGVMESGNTHDGSRVINPSQQAITTTDSETKITPGTRIENLTRTEDLQGCHRRRWHVRALH